MSASSRPTSLGVNVEFGSELLWREYPTDQRGSSFRQFWDVSAHAHSAGLSRPRIATRR